MSRVLSNSGSKGNPIPNHLTLLDLVSLDDLQQLQDSLAQIANVKSVICDPDGNFLTTPSNEIPMCRIIRQSPQGENDCMLNLNALSAQIKETPKTIIRTCESLGILKAAVPIVVQDIHVANWWISMCCADLVHPDQMRVYAERIGIDAQALLREAEKWPQGSRNEFEKVLAWIDHLARRIALLGYKNLLLSRDLSKLHHLESELDLYKTDLEKLVQSRMADVIIANKRLQLQALERDLTEEQIERKSKLLNAINQVLQQIVNDRSEQALAATCLRAAQQLTGSPFGFMVEQQEHRWRVVASEHPEEDEDLAAKARFKKSFEVSAFWQELVRSGKSVCTQAPQEQPLWQPLTQEYPEIETLLAVALPGQSGISGFIALANKPGGYALVDQTDVEELTQSFAEALVRTRKEHAKHISEKRLTLALDSAEEGLWDFLPQARQIYYSPRWFAMLGYNTGDLPFSLETWTTLTHPEDLPILAGTFEDVAKSGEDAVQIEIRMLTERGQWRWFQVRGRTVERDADGNVLRMVGTLIDISKYKQVELALQKANEELVRLAALDDLTQIANRRRFDERLAEEWRRARRDSTPLAIVICDIDFFKAYNDTYGHVKGDEALYAVAQAIHTILKRPMDLVARYGGEEFAMVLPNTDLEGAGRVAKKVKSAIQGLLIKHRASSVSEYITLSFGVAAAIPENDLMAKALLELADKALYHAKTLGRNRIVRSDAEMSEVKWRND